MMTICFLSLAHPPYDKRVFDKEAVSLAKAGFRVIHLAPDETAGTDQKEGVEVRTYPRARGLVQRFFAIPHLYRLAREVNADCYHCNEVDSWVVGVALKLLRRKPLVVDVHEHYPSVFAESRFPAIFRPMVSWAILALMRVLASFTDWIVLAKTSVAADFSRCAKKCVLVQNFTPLAYADAFDELAPQPAEQPENAPLTAIHLGLVSRVRGWPQLLEAVKRAKSKNIRLLFVGTFNDGSREEFDKIAEESGLTERIRTYEWMPFTEAYKNVVSSDIGLVLFQPGILNHVYALPHKMFDYMLAGIPVIAPAFAKEVAEIVEKADCGILVDPSNPDDIAAALDCLATNPEERRRLGENGRRAVLEEYNWEAEAEKLIRMYQTIATLRKE